MVREDSLSRLRRHEADLRHMGVKSLFLFGSTARQEARANSDVDLFFDYDPDTLGLIELVAIKDAASDILGCPADVMTRDSINLALRPRVEAAALRVF